MSTRSHVDAGAQIYYMGTMQNMSADGTAAPDGFPCLTNDSPPRPTASAGGPHCQQRVGLAVSRDPAGPWQRYDANGLHNSTEQSTYILPTGSIGDFDSGFTNNPTPLALKNGVRTKLLLRRGASRRLGLAANGTCCRSRSC